MTERAPGPVGAGDVTHPAVSVVIPCYRQAEYLAEAVESVVGQTYRDWEIVIVDDGSPDDTAAVAEGLIAGHPDRRIRLVRQPNAGLAAARNAGIAASTGRYILPLDADDVLMPEMLARTVALLDAEPGVAIAYTDFEHFGADRRRVRVGVWNLEALAYSNQLGICSLFRREVWTAVGGYNPNMARGYEDWDFWIGAAERGFEARHIAEPLFRYRRKEESRDTAAWTHRRALRRQLARNHPRVFSRGRRLRYAIRRVAGALRYRAATIAGRVGRSQRRGAT
jgi:glycosyltransferase involved in cell wall biosynthesis